MKYVPGEVIVKWRKSVDETGRGRVRAKHGLKDHPTGRHWQADNITHHHGVPHGGELALAEKLMRDHPGDVLWAEPNGLLTFEPVEEGAANFTASADDWWLKQVGAIVAAAGVDKLPEIRCGIVDSGYRHAEPFFAGCMANEKNFVTTISPTGAQPDSTEDNEGHGTATLSIELDVLKLFTAQPRVSLGRVMSQNSASWANVAQGVLWIINLVDFPQAIGCSIGGNTNSFSLTDAATKCQAKGVAWICAAGNSSSTTKQYPAATPGAYAIAATKEPFFDGATWREERASFTNTGDWITASFPGTNFRCPTLSGADGNFNGTSASAPGFAACVAVVAAIFKITGVAAVAKILATCKKLKDAALGAGRADLAAALGITAQDPAPPPAPTPDPDPAPSGDLVNLAKLGAWTSSPTNPNTYNGKSEGLPQMTDDRSDTKCLWLDSSPWAQHDAGRKIQLKRLRGLRANDYPQRDIAQVKVFADGAAAATVDIPQVDTRFSPFDVALPDGITGQIFRYEFRNRSGSITQVAEFAPWGAVVDATQSPPPDVTWTTITDPAVVTFSDYAPATAEQTRTVTTSVRTYEKSSTGEIRNDHTDTSTATEQRTVPLPVN